MVLGSTWGSTSMGSRADTYGFLFFFLHPSLRWRASLQELTGLTGQGHGLNASLRCGRWTLRGGILVPNPICTLEEDRPFFSIPGNADMLFSVFRISSYIVAIWDPGRISVIVWSVPIGPIGPQGVMLWIR